ncbi:hypothetical protein CP532_0450 [Ophiocordyceps camponoti-leonardi (nom. inval.)]|nr:hypothetical protein CP532_0450 [Ophiocordyceps camponoti-leonardi (nom. inval.)]
MPNDDILTDEYVANLLAEEAKNYSLRYSAMGIEAAESSKPAKLPRPNTGFLRRIIKSTDTHNKALLAKEATESKVRLDALNRSSEAQRRRRNPDARDICRRQMGDIHSILGRAKRTGHVSKLGLGGQGRDGDGRQHDHSDAVKREREGQRDRDVRLPRDRYDHHDVEMRDKAAVRNDEQRSTRAASYIDFANEGDDGRRGRFRRARSPSPRRLQQRQQPQQRRSRSPAERDRAMRHERERSHHRGRLSPSKHAPNPSNDYEVDSDPLEELIGPAPPARFHGRGAMGGAASLDRRFSQSYDPKADVQMDDADDWDDAAERFRDRQKLRSMQTQRMRDAGFTDAQMQVMQGRPETSEREVVWSKAGEPRAWDQGKRSGVGTEYAPRGLFSEFD